MTNGEHNMWLGDALRSIPTIGKAIAINNGITIAKELYELGELTKEDYIKSLKNMCHSCGFTIE